MNHRLADLWSRSPAAWQNFWRWWLRELRHLSRDAADLLTGLGRSRFTVVLTEEVVWVEETRGRVVTKLPAAQLRDGPRRLAEDPRLFQWPAALFKRPVRLVLPKSWVLIKEFSFPHAVAPHLHSTLDLQLDRHCPLPRESVLWDVEAQLPIDARPRLPARLGIVRRSDVEALLQRLSDWNIRVRDIGCPTEMASALSFLPKRRVADTAIAVPILNRRLALGAVALVMAIVATGIGVQWRERRVLQSALDEAQAAARPVAEMRATAIAALQRIDQIQSLESRSHLSPLLAELSSRLPSNVWIQELDVDHGAVRLRGIAPAGANLAAFLSTSQIVKMPELVSVQSTGLGTQQDRFELSLSLRTPEHR